MNVKFTHSAKARVRLEVEIDVGSTWGADCTVQQVYDQASEEARNHLVNLLRKAGERHIRIIGEISVSAIVADRKPA